MNRCVPDFDTEDEHYKSKSSLSSSRHKGEGDVMELLWHDGQVVTQSQTQRVYQKSPATDRPENAPTPQPPQENTTHLCMGEDEMANWLHYPLEDLYTDLLYPTSNLPAPPLQQSPSLATTVTPSPEFRLQLPAARPPVPPPARNFPQFSRFGERERAPEPVTSRTGMTVVDSNRPTSATPVSGIPTTAVEGSSALSRAPPFAGGGGSGDMTVTSSTSGSRSESGKSGAAAVTATVAAVTEGEKRKRKRGEGDEATATTTGCRNEDVEPDSADDRGHSRNSASKRTRAAEVHNLSERRRRDRINEKMKALQELIPRCNKSDKASMLDEAIEYLKSLQMQVQMMSMGCGMVPMMYPPGMQQHYMPPMGMGMGVDMGISRPMMSFLTPVPPPAMPATPSGSVVFAPPQLTPRFPIAAYPMPPGHPRMQMGIQSEPVRNPVPIQTASGLPQFANLADPYQQYMALQQMQMQAQMQSQSVTQPGSSKPSSSKPSTGISGEDFEDR